MTSLTLLPNPAESGFAKIDLNPTLRENTKHLYKVPLQNLNCSFDVVTPRETSSLKHIIKQHSKINHTDVTIMYAIRQPGCPSCREHGLQLQKFSSTDRRLALIGAVKETGKADEEILRFYQDYFRNPIYKDEKWNVYKALGGRKLSFKQAFLGFLRSKKRFRRKNISIGKHATEAFVQGGVLIFDREGQLRFAYNEEFKELDMELVASAVAETRRLSRSKRTSIDSATSVESSESSK
jgi:hypothetical protein